MVSGNKLNQFLAHNTIENENRAKMFGQKFNLCDFFEKNGIRRAYLRQSSAQFKVLKLFADT